jgi:hypothetical protein
MHQHKHNKKLAKTILYSVQVSANKNRANSSLLKAEQIEEHRS